jgi:hypothetical protein
VEMGGDGWGLAYRAASRRTRGSAAWRRGEWCRDWESGCSARVQYLESISWTRLATSVRARPGPPCIDKGNVTAAFLLERMPCSANAMRGAKMRRRSWSRDGGDSVCVRLYAHGRDGIGRQLYTIHYIAPAATALPNTRCCCRHPSAASATPASASNTLGQLEWHVLILPSPSARPLLL